MRLALARAMRCCMFWCKAHTLWGVSVAINAASQPWVTSVPATCMAGEAISRSRRLCEPSPGWRRSDDAGAIRAAMCPGTPRPRWRSACSPRHTSAFTFCPTTR
ncbi:MAG: hypothetical protein J3K34DRAFT_26180 [Monoraphidium minutum]|nr:MAG: hypothetical protein J3K34DRAFT_26180 [Monoraphidium minutum]